MENFTIQFSGSQFIFPKNGIYFYNSETLYLKQNHSRRFMMKKKIVMLSFVFWWTIMFPVLNFTENELINIQQENIQYKSFLMEILQ